MDKRERELLERLAAEGKATRVPDEDLSLARGLEGAGLLFLVGARAVITPRGRRLLAELEQMKKSKKPPSNLLE